MEIKMMIVAMIGIVILLIIEFVIQQMIMRRIVFMEVRINVMSAVLSVLLSPEEGPRAVIIPRSVDGPALDKFLLQLLPKERRNPAGPIGRPKNSDSNPGLDPAGGSSTSE